MNPQEAHDAANLSSIIPIALGLAVGILIGVKSKNPIPCWQILALVLISAISVGMIDGALSTDYGGWVRLASAAIAVGIFLSRKSPGDQNPQFPYKPPGSAQDQPGQDQE